MDDTSPFATVGRFGVDYAPHNRGITPVFRLVPVQDHKATEREGYPVHVNKEEVTLFIAGDPLSAATHPVDEKIKARFSEQYEKWKRDKSGAHIVGMPLSKWPMATPGMIKELEFLNVLSVEDLASISDGNVSNITEGRALREKAIAWLASAKDGAAAMRFAAENQRLRDEVADLRKTVEKFVGDGKTPGIDRSSQKYWKNPVEKPRKPKRKSAWTPERRAAASEAMKARHAREPTILTLGADD